MDSAAYPRVTAHSGKGEQTMLQLVAAAQKLFADRGFQKTSIRDIANEAGSNVAAVNYHFGSKENLYREVFRRHQTAVQQRAVVAVRDVVDRSGGRPTIGAVLEAFVQSFVESRAPGEARSFNLLIHRELAEPHLDPHFLLEEILEPLHRGLAEAISAACPGLGAGTLNMCVHSFLAQLIHLRSLEVYFGDHESDVLSALDTEEAIRHIVELTGAGIKALQKREK